MFILPTARPGTTTTSGGLVISASDIMAAVDCRFASMRTLDVVLGRIPRPAYESDPMLERAALLGDVHETAYLDTLIERYGAASVYTVEHSHRGMSRELLEARHRETLEALRGPYEVVYQASFFDGTFHGRADFLIRDDNGDWAVYDTKLARSAKKGPMLQLAAYAEQLMKAGIPVSPYAHLVLGTSDVTSHELAELLPPFQAARDGLLLDLALHRAGTEAAEWFDEAWKACLRCPECALHVEERGDLKQVRGMNVSRRAKLHAAGVKTIHEFAAADLASLGFKPDPMWLALHEQARLQTGHDTGDGTVNGVSYKVIDTHTLGDLPAPSDGDIFFDFEGDPLWFDPATGSWDLEYLFGLLEKPMPWTGLNDDEVFVAFTAHTLAEEKQALTDFMEHVAERRRLWPDLHIYHYADYEVKMLRHLTARHGVYRDELTALIDEGVFVDVYTTVKRSLRISNASLSIKKLEPLYMPDHRTGVATAVESINQYEDYCKAVAAGEETRAKEIFQGILDYNEYDCLSTLKLRDWLLTLR